MKITILVLKGYTRLLLNNINYIKLTPKSKIQLILGSNGSGKSSLMKELTPLPATHTEFTSDGYKEITIEHRGSIYLLKSDFRGKGNKYHFIKNGEDLNQGLTISVYKELVSKEFNITQEVHNLMTGSSTFHGMSISERRNWFTKISDSDYTYAIRFYNKIKEQLRDIQGAVKLNKARLVQESDKLMDSAEETIARKDIEDLHKLLNMLLDLRINSNVDRSTISLELNNIEKTLGELSQGLLTKGRQFINDESFTCLDDLKLAILEAKSFINITNQRSEEIYQIVDKDKTTIETVEKTNIDSIVDLDERCFSISNEISSIKNQVKYDITFTDLTTVLSTLINVQPYLISIFSSLQSNKDGTISRTRFNELTDNVTVSNDKLQVLDKQQFKLIKQKEDLEHLKEHNKIDCPECKHTWSAGYSESDYKILLVLIDKIASEIMIETDKLVVTKDELEVVAVYMNLILQYRELVTSWIILKPLWNMLSDNLLVRNNPELIPNLVIDVIEDVKLQLKIVQLENDLQDLNKFKDLISKDSETDIDKLKADIIRLESELHKNNLEVQSKTVFIKRIEFYFTMISELDVDSLRINKLIDYRKDKVNSLIEARRQEALNKIIQVVRLRISDLESTLSKTDIQRSLVDNLSSQVNELEERAKVLKLAVKELSPSEGLIAKGLTGFINNFVFQMNTFIAKIWLYPLELVPIKIDDEHGVDLDFKLMVKVNDGKPVPDVSKTSSAMKEVIDLAFKIVSMQYLGLSEAPLFLDELGASFDKEHRKSVHSIIHSLSTSSDFSQFFIISHYEEMHGSFTNSDITLLSSTNVTLPRDLTFNKHVIME